MKYRCDDCEPGCIVDVGLSGEAPQICPFGQNRELAWDELACSWREVTE